jgi:hypothetical protein
LEFGGMPRQNIGKLVTTWIVHRKNQRGNREDSSPRRWAA